MLAAIRGGGWLCVHRLESGYEQTALPIAGSRGDAKCTMLWRKRCADSVRVVPIAPSRFSYG